MIKFDHKAMWLRAWGEFIRDVACGPVRIYSGVRKIVDNVGFEMTGPTFFCKEDPLTFADLAFTERGKMNQLNRNYFDPQFWKEAVAKVKSRKNKPHTSVGIPLRAAGKDSRSQGFCMQNLVLSITYGQKVRKITIDVFYRSTEVTQKMTADLLFFRKVIPEYLLKPCGIKPEDVDEVRFHFANAYLSCVFIPIILRFFLEGPIAFLESFKTDDVRFYNSACGTVARYLRRVNVYNYVTQKKQYLYMHDRFTERELDALRKKLKAYCNRIPKEQHGEHDEDDD